MGAILALVPLVVGGFAIVAFLMVAMRSIHRIGETEVGLVKKLWGKPLGEGQVIAFNGEAGYQEQLLMPGLRWKMWPLYSVEKFPWVSVGPNKIGVCHAQIGAPLEQGRRSGIYKPEFGLYDNPATFLKNGGQKGIQRRVLPPGTTLPIHPVAFLVITEDGVFGLPVDPDLANKSRDGKRGLTADDFGKMHGPLLPTVIEPRPIKDMGGMDDDGLTAEGKVIKGSRGKKSRVVDVIGIVTTHEGAPLEGNDLASRIGGFEDMRDEALTESRLRIEKLLGTQNGRHESYQNFQAFLDAGGRIGLQHDPLLYGTYLLNPYLVSVEVVPMLEVGQGEVAVIKAFVGLIEEDTSGVEYKHGTTVRPGHRGVWDEPLRTGKYPLNPRCYEPVIVPTQVLTLNWAEASSTAHDLDKELKAIDAKSREGFPFTLDLQVQVHVPDKKAPRVIGAVGTMSNLVNEVLQAAVGNHFRNTLQAMPAVTFIETRDAVQEEADKHIRERLDDYEVETIGVYIQAVKLPEELVSILKQREQAKQQEMTYAAEEKAQQTRISLEATRGTADKQADLAASKVGIEISGNNAESRKKAADGEAYYTRETGAAAGAEIEAVGMARAKAFEKQKEALGEMGTVLVNVVQAIGDKSVKIMPEVLVTGGNGSPLDALMATLTRNLNKGGSLTSPPSAPASTEAKAS